MFRKKIHMLPCTVNIQIIETYPHRVGGDPEQHLSYKKILITKINVYFGQNDYRGYIYKFIIYCSKIREREGGG